MSLRRLYIAIQNWSCNPPKPLWSSRLRILINVLLEKFFDLQTYKQY